MGPSRFWKIFGLAVAALLGTATLSVARAQQPTTPPARDTARAAPGARPDTAAADTGAARRPAADAATEGILQQLQRLPGFTATEYQGKTAVYRASEGVLRLEGSAEVQREGSRLSADTIIYRDRDDMVHALGNPKVTGEAQEIEGDELLYNLATRSATAFEARTKVAESATWFVEGDVSLVGTQRVYARHGSFTTCDLEIPHYHFESDQIKIIKDRLLIARPARLYFGKVPVMVLPFVFQNLQTGRRSGLLVPRFGINDIVRSSSDYTRELRGLGWYWALNDYMGAQVSGTWRSGAYTSILADLDFNWRRQFLTGRASVERFWRDGGSTALNLRSNASWRPDERTQLGLDASFASSSQFVRQSTYDPREVSQDLQSNLRVNRRFDWGSVDFGAQRRQSIANSSVDMTLPQLSIAPKPLTFFKAATPEAMRWYSNSTLNLNASGSRVIRQAGEGPSQRLLGDEARTDGRFSQSFTVGNFSWSNDASLNRTILEELRDTTASSDILRRRTVGDRANLASSFSYRQRLVGTSSITPTLALSQEIVRDTSEAFNSLGYVGGPRRMSFGAGVNTDVFGFFPGVGGYDRIRHRLSPRVSYSYSPAVTQSALQDSIFGRSTSRAQNIVSLSFNQTFEAKLRAPRTAAADTAGRDTAGTPAVGDTTRAGQAEQTPGEPQKVTLLSIDTSPLQYDFVRAREEGNGFITDRISNSISSDYLKGLVIQVEHELFDPPPPLAEGEAYDRGITRRGSFNPKLSRLSTGFELGPGSALFRWLGLRDDARNETTQGTFPGSPPSDQPRTPGQGAFTGNPQSTGGGNWRLGVQYSFSRQPLFAQSGQSLGDEGVQTTELSMAFPLTPSWAMNWVTSYSITDGKFGAHRLNFRRNLHRWQANFDFYQTPNGNSAFVFSVELLDNTDLHVDYRENNLGIDRGR